MLGHLFADKIELMEKSRQSKVDKALYQQELMESIANKEQGIAAKEKMARNDCEDRSSEDVNMTDKEVR